MEDAVDARARTPIHLWIVGVLATLWNAMHAYDYWMTRARDTDYIAGMGFDPQIILNYVDSFPIWASAGWALGVWSALAGSILLLLRNRFAVPAFLLSLVGMVLSFSYQFLVQKPPAEMTEGALAFIPLVVIAIGIGLFVYARAMKAKGVLK